MNQSYGMDDNSLTFKPESDIEQFFSPNDVYWICKKRKKLKKITCILVEPVKPEFLLNLFLYFM